MFETVENAAEYSGEEQQKADQDDRAPDRPQALDALEMLDAVPAPITPSPAAALGAEHEWHDEADQRNESQQRDVGVVADAPDPVEQERAPVPAVEFGRDVLRFDAYACVGHVLNDNTAQ